MPETRLTTSHRRVPGVTKDLALVHYAAEGEGRAAEGVDYDAEEEDHRVVGAADLVEVGHVVQGVVQVAEAVDHMDFSLMVDLPGVGGRPVEVDSHHLAQLGAETAVDNFRTATAEEDVAVAAPVGCVDRAHHPKAAWADRRTGSEVVAVAVRPLGLVGVADRELDHTDHQDVVADNREEAAEDIPAEPVGHRVVLASCAFRS